jgi:hypothetical protein
MKTVKKTSAKKYQRGGTANLLKGLINAAAPKPSGLKDIVKKPVTKPSATAGGPSIKDSGSIMGKLAGKTGSKKKGGATKPKAAYGMAVKPSMMQSGGERESFASRKIKTVSVSPDKNYKTTVKEKMGPSGVSTKVANRRTVKGVASGAPKPRMMKKGGTTKKKK